MRTNKNSFSFLIILLLCILVFASACGWSGSPGDASDLDYKDEVIAVSGFEDKEFTFTPLELAKLDSVEREISSTNSWGNKETEQAYGPLLSTFIEEYWESDEEFSLVRFESEDGYYVELTGEDIKKDKYVLSFRSGDEPLEKRNQPLRLLTPDKESSYWVRGVTKIIFEK